MKTRTSASELKLNLAPRRRFEAIDVTARISKTSDLLRRHQRALFCSMHTTAAYLDRSLTLRMTTSSTLLSRFFHAFRGLFPEGAEYTKNKFNPATEWRKKKKTAKQRTVTCNPTST